MVLEEYDQAIDRAQKDVDDAKTMYDSTYQALVDAQKRLADAQQVDPPAQEPEGLQMKGLLTLAEALPPDPNRSFVESLRMVVAQAQSVPQARSPPPSPPRKGSLAAKKTAGDAPSLEAQGSASGPGNGAPQGGQEGSSLKANSKSFGSVTVVEGRRVWSSPKKSNQKESQDGVSGGNESNAKKPVVSHQHIGTPGITGSPARKSRRVDGGNWADQNDQDTSDMDADGDEWTSMTPNTVLRTLEAKQQELEEAKRKAAQITGTTVTGSPKGAQPPLGPTPVDEPVLPPWPLGPARETLPQLPRRVAVSSEPRARRPPSPESDAETGQFGASGAASRPWRRRSAPYSPPRISKTALAAAKNDGAIEGKETS